MSEHTNLKNILEMCFANNGEFQWSFIDAYFEDNDESLSDVEKFSIFCDKVIDNFNSFDFSDVVLVARIIDMIIISIDPDIPRENDTFKESVLNVMSRTLEQRQESELFHICSDLDFAYVAKTMFTGRVDLMKILVRYGVCNSSSTREEGNETPIASGNRRASKFIELVSGGKLKLCGIPALCDYFFAASHGSSTGVNRRHGTILLGVKLANSEWTSDHRDSPPHCEIDTIKCYKLAFQVLKKPIITYTETRHMLFGLARNDDDMSMGRALLEQVEKLMPECVRPYQPRSLLHLSRCHVRQVLRKFGILPHLVSQLFIPETLKTILLPDDERDFKY